ncbi:hypothetical protein ES288_D09G109600v1 [Gossypium darwinii]|uniref:Uncharacterized protein n=1 Tax=Gossypium darwinii TaxID=34276 RepID=A0A5D2BAW2_GOSDA|nr:hypothetical protein ES288_D09G109600v1 [Gossypium darwinii]
MNFKEIGDGEHSIPSAYRTITTALNVLRFNLMYVFGEVKELMELVEKQARKARIENDPNNEQAMRRALWVLD